MFFVAWDADAARTHIRIEILSRAGGARTHDLTDYESVALPTELPPCVHRSLLNAIGRTLESTMAR